MNDNVDRRRRGAWLGLLMVLLMALASAGYALSSSPSAPTGPSGKSSGTTSTDVLAPSASTKNGNNGGNGGGGTDNCVDPSSETGNCDHRFGVTVGQTPLLYPGVVRSLPVTFTNPNNFDIYITSYRVSVSVPVSNATACPASSLQVPTGTVTPNPRLTVVKNGSVITTVPIKLSADAPEGCQQVTFAITVNASGVKK